MKRRLLALGLSIAIVGGALVGCGNANAPASAATSTASTASEKDTASSEKRKVLTAGAQDIKLDSDKDWWPSDFFKLLGDKLNADIQWTNYDNEQFKLALASGNMPDVFMANDYKSVLEGKLAVPLDDYLDQYGANIRKFETRNALIRKYMSNGDGKLYFHTPYTGKDDPTAGTELWNGFLVRWDLYKKIGAPVMKTDDDYIKVMKQMQELYPKTEAGDSVYGLGVFNDSGLWGWMIRSLANGGWNNIKSWAYCANTQTNELQQAFLDTENGQLWKNLGFYNKVYRAGLLDPDSFSMKGDEVKGKAEKKQYVGAFSIWYTNKMYDAAREEDPNSLTGIIAVPGEGQNGWYGGNSQAGWINKLTFVTSKAKDIPLAVQFIDLLDSDDANRAHASGIQGKQWDYKDGVPTLFPETIALRAKGGDEWSKIGIDSFSNLIGSNPFEKHKDGAYYSLWSSVEIKKQTLSPLQKDFSDFYKVDYPSELHLNMVKEGKAINFENSIIDTITMGIPTLPDDITRINSQLEEMVMRAIPAIVMAKTDEEYKTAQDKLVSELKAANADKAWQWMKAEWDKSLEYAKSLNK